MDTGIFMELQEFRIEYWILIDSSGPIYPGPDIQAGYLKIVTNIFKTISFKSHSLQLFVLGFFETNFFTEAPRDIAKEKMEFEKNCLQEVNQIILIGTRLGRRRANQ